MKAAEDDFFQLKFIFLRFTQNIFITTTDKNVLDSPWDFQNISKHTNKKEKYERVRLFGLKK